MSESFRPDGSFERFNNLYPGLGEIKEGKFVPPDHWEKFCDVYINKIRYIQAAVRDLTPEEGTFIDHTSDIASQCVQYWIEKFYRNPANKSRRFLPTILPNDQSSFIIPSLRRCIVEIEKADLQGAASSAIPSLEDMGNKPEGLIKALDHMTHLKHSVRRNKDLRKPVIDYATNIMRFIPLLAQYNEGLVIDEYIEARVRELINVYISTE